MNNTQQLENTRITKHEAKLVFRKKILIGQSTLFTFLRPELLFDKLLFDF